MGMRDGIDKITIVLRMLYVYIFNTIAQMHQCSCADSCDLVLWFDTPKSRSSLLPLVKPIFGNSDLFVVIPSASKTHLLD